MEMTTIQVTKKADIQVPFFICEPYRCEKDNLYAEVWLEWHRHTPKYTITYWQKGKDSAVKFMSHCKTERGAISKVAKFLNVK